MSAPAILDDTYCRFCQEAPAVDEASGLCLACAADLADDLGVLDEIERFGAEGHRRNDFEEGQ